MYGTGIGSNNAKHQFDIAWERGRGNMIFSEDLAGDTNLLMKQFPPP